MKIGRVIVLLLLVGVLAFLGLGGIRAYQRSLDRQGEALHARVLPSGEPDAAQVSALAKQAAALPPAKVPTQADYVADVNATIAKLPGASSAMLEAIRDTLASLPGGASDAVGSILQRGGLDPKARAELARVAPMLKRRAAAERRYADHERAYLRAALAAYQQYGNRDPKWDAAACKALTLLIEVPPGESQPYENPGTAAAIDLFNKAFDIGFCTDPLLREVRDRLIQSFHAVEDQGVFPTAQAMGPRNMSVATSRYPTVWKVDLFDGKVSPAVMDPTSAKQFFVQIVTQGVDYSRSDLDAFFASDTFTPDEKYHWAQQYLVNTDLEVRVELPAPAMSYSEKEFGYVDSLLTKHMPSRVEPLLLKGEFYLKYAWEARGRGFAKDVPPEGWRLMKERLKVADAALSEAWKLDPSDPRAATIMITVKLGEESDPSEYFKWFDRAMEADPDNYDACYRAMYYLDPKWFGSPDELLRFAGVCRQTRNYRARLPLLVAEAHVDIARDTHPNDLSAYLSTPEPGRDIHDVFESYLALFPEDRMERTYYACLAALSHRWDDADRQFHILGDNPWPDVFERYSASYENLREQAARSAGKSPTKDAQ